MKLCVLTGQYPNEDSPYRHMFVHTRNRWYREFGHEVLVLVPAKTRKEYIFDSVNVIEGPVEELIKDIEKYQPDVATIHLLLHRFQKEMDAGIWYDWLAANKMPTMFFVHGVEVQKVWKSLRGDVQWQRPLSVMRMLYRDFYLIGRMVKTLKKFLADPSHCKFVAPSKWMFQEAFDTVGLPLGEHGTVIANGIDTELFRFTDRWEDRHKVLSIRPFTSQAKYALDLFVDSAVEILQKEAQFHLYGSNLHGVGATGEASDMYNAIASRNIANLTLHRTFFANREVPGIHQQFGIYAAVTRMDAQGVSMCEAMSSGLPTVSFDITAINEFIESGESGFLSPTYDVQDYVEKIGNLMESRSLFDRIAANGRKRMEAIDVRKTCQQEIDIANSF